MVLSTLPKGLNLSQFLSVQSVKTKWGGAGRDMVHCASVCHKIQETLVPSLEPALEGEN